MTTAADTIQELPLDQVRPDPANPRSQPDEDLAALEQNLKHTRRLLQPIRVRPDGEGYVVITGERRLLAARRAGWERIPAIVDGAATGEGIVVDQLVENCLRRDMPLLDTARALQTLLDDSGLERKELAQRLGQSPAWVSRMTRLLAMTGAARDALETGLLTCAQAAASFARLPRRQQARLLREAKRTGTPISRRRIDPMLGTDPAKREPVEKGDQVWVALAPAQLRRIITALGGTPTDDDATLSAQLRAALRTKTPQRRGEPR